jgi:PAS domain S-box-containing protein
MNSGDSMLFSSNAQFAFPPEAELKFADFLINQTVDAAFCLGVNAQLLYVNNTTCRMTEYSREELLSMTLPDIDIDFSLHEWLVKNPFKSENPLNFKSRYRTKRGRIFPVEIVMTYVEHQGKEFSCFLVREKNDELVNLNLEQWLDESKYTKEHLQEIDITGYKQDKLELYQALEQAKKLNEFRTYFISMVCHQFLTPLNIISFSNSLLKRHIDKWTDDKIFPLIDQIQASVEQLNQMLDDILFLSKIDAAKLNFEPQPLDLVEFCHNLLAKWLLTSSQNQVKFSYSGNPTTVWLDTKLLEPILNNLLDNAIKYSLPDSVVDLELFFEDKKVIFQVKDRGIGIPIADQKNLFEPFYRGSNIKQIPGTGLGLSIVKTLVDLHLGEMMLVSEVDIGTTMTVILPSVIAQSTPKSESDVDAIT